MKITPKPPAGLKAPPTVKICKTGWSHSRIPAGCISGRERQKEECLKLSFWTSLWERKHVLVPRALFHWGQQSREIRNQCSKEESRPHPASALTQSCHQYHARKSWPSYTYCPPPQNRQKIRNYTLLAISWGRPRQVVQGQGEHMQNCPRRLNSASQGDPRGPTLPIATVAPSRGRWRWYRWCC